MAKQPEHSCSEELRDSTVMQYNDEPQEVLGPAADERYGELMILLFFYIVKQLIMQGKYMKVQIGFSCGIMNIYG